MTDCSKVMLVFFQCSAKYVLRNLYLLQKKTLRIQTKQGHPERGVQVPEKCFLQHLLEPSLLIFGSVAAGVNLKATQVIWSEAFPPAFTQWIREVMHSLKV